MTEERMMRPPRLSDYEVVEAQQPFAEHIVKIHQAIRTVKKLEIDIEDLDIDIDPYDFDKFFKPYDDAIAALARAVKHMSDEMEEIAARNEPEQEFYR